MKNQVKKFTVQSVGKKGVRLSDKDMKHFLGGYCDDDVNGCWKVTCLVPPCGHPPGSTLPCPGDWKGECIGSYNGCWSYLESNCYSFVMERC